LNFRITSSLYIYVEPEDEEVGRVGRQRIIDDVIGINVDIDDGDLVTRKDIDDDYAPVPSGPRPARLTNGWATRWANHRTAGQIVDYILQSAYPYEFIIAECFDPEFVAELASAGFLVMSEDINFPNGDYILLPKHHLVRSVLFFEDLHIGKTIRRFLPKYTLRAGADYEEIVQNCIKTHGDEWLTKPLIECLARIRRMKNTPVRPYSFALYRENKLVAGEFGVICGRVYTSYSGYCTEKSSGRAQMILTALYLEKAGFDFWDLGMPLDYKYTLGARDITINEFIGRFRGAQDAPDTQ